MSTQNSLPRQLIAAVASDAQQTGWFQSVDTAEPKSAPSTDGHFATWVMKLSPSNSTSDLVSTAVRFELAGCIYVNMLREPQGDIDGDIMAAGWDLIARYSAGFTLGGLVREVDLLGEEGEPLSIQFGYVTIDKRIYRIAALTIPLIVDYAFDQGA